MARDIWVTSDQHWHHANILKFRDGQGSLIRPEFSSVEEMDAYMVEKWNEVIKPGDIAYHLGDVFVGNKDAFKAMWPKLHGSKRLIVGNHDDIRFMSSGGFFKKVTMWRMFPEHRLLFSHVPVHESSLERGGGSSRLVNIHGHIHQNDSPPGRYINVCVEKTGYAPVHIEDLAAQAKVILEEVGD